MQSSCRRCAIDRLDHSAPALRPCSSRRRSVPRVGAAATAAAAASTAPTMLRSLRCASIALNSRACGAGPGPGSSSISSSNSSSSSSSSNSSSRFGKCHRPSTLAAAWSGAVPGGSGESSGDGAAPQQQQQQPNQPRQQLAAAVTDEQQDAKRSWLLELLPAPIARALSVAARFLASCCEVLPRFVAPPLPEALRRAGLVLAVSLLLVVVVSTVDSAWLYLYLLRARQVAV